MVKNWLLNSLLNRLLQPNLGLYLFIFVLITPFRCFASDNLNKSDYQQELDRLYNSIDKVQKHLKTTRYRRSNVLTELKTLEQEISQNSISLNKLSITIKKLTSNNHELRANIRTLNKNLGKQKNNLTRQIKAAYSFGTQQKLKMLLNLQDPAVMGQIQIYFDYLHRDQTQQIQQFMHTIKEKRTKEQALKATLKKQKIALSDQRTRKNLLVNQRFKRNRLLAQINLAINNQEQNLTDLESSRTRIENLLNSLGELLADIPPGPSDKATFSSQKGQLPWPVDGPFISHYGNKRRGDLKWNGVLIGTSYGVPVKAISHGRIAFSDWLQGFGFITIINHDEGYMSLYGHNESLFKQTGDWVAAGDVIASTGDSGGHPVSGLYFEIRARGKTVDPALWCNSRIRHP